LRAGCSKAKPKIFAPPQTLPGGSGRPKFNQLEMVTTFTYRLSLVKIDACNFELTDPRTNKQIHKQTGPITIHCAAKLSAQCINTNVNVFLHIPRRGLICPLLRRYKYQKVFCFREFDPLTRAPGPPLGLHLQTPFRGSACCPPYILDLTTPLHGDRNKCCGTLAGM